MVKYGDIFTKSQLMDLKEISIQIRSDKKEFARLKHILYNVFEKTTIPDGNYKVIEIQKDKKSGPRASLLILSPIEF